MYYTPELPLDKFRIFVYNMGTMVTQKELKERAEVIRKRGMESYQACRFCNKNGKILKAAVYRGQYQAYCDSYHLINILMNTTKKGGDS